MALLKPQLAKPSKKEYCVRIDELLALTMERYAEFLGATTNSYVISQALEFVFQRDSDFKQWLKFNPEPGSRKGNHNRASSPVGEQTPTVQGSSNRDDGGE